MKMSFDISEFRKFRNYAHQIVRDMVDVEIENELKPYEEIISNIVGEANKTRKNISRKGRGNTTGSVLLSDSDILFIREQRKNGVRVVDLAKRFCVSTPTIYRYTK